MTSSLTHLLKTAHPTQLPEHSSKYAIVGLLSVDALSCTVCSSSNADRYKYILCTLVRKNAENFFVFQHTLLETHLVSYVIRRQVEKLQDLPESAVTKCSDISRVANRFLSSRLIERGGYRLNLIWRATYKYKFSQKTIENDNQ